MDTRLTTQDPQTRTVLAERDGAVAGFACTLLGQDPDRGAFLDNLHIAYGLKGQGIGTRLLTLTAQAVLHASPASGLYLWVLEQNSDAVPSTPREVLPAWTASTSRRQAETPRG